MREVRETRHNFAGSHLAVVVAVRMESRRIRFYRTLYVVDFIEYYIWKKNFVSILSKDYCL